MRHQTKYTLGLDFGTNSARALLVDAADGREISAAVWNYAGGEHGIILDRRDANLARQQPADYTEGIARTVRAVLRSARRQSGQFAASAIIGIGVDTTGSTPLPIDRHCRALAAHPAYANHPHAMAWLWKDHTAHAEAAEITALAARRRPEYLARCGGTYSSEWFWAKLLHCRRVAPAVFKAAYTWVEIADWIPAMLAGIGNPAEIRRGICAAGHKAMFHAAWGGYPERAWLHQLDPELARIRDTLPAKAYTAADRAGTLAPAWAKRLGLPAGIPIAVGAFDAHLGAVGAGIRPGTLVKIIGTSTCDMAIEPLERKLPDIPGLCGIVPESILPGYYGLEAGQSAVGDIFNWFVNQIAPRAGGHHELTRQAEKLRPGTSGLLALDWHNGNRTVLVDQRLTGAILGLTLHTTPAEIYRALVEATAFGARVIMERLGEYGVRIRRIVNCGGIAAKNPMVMQIYADIMNRPLAISRSAQTCALGAAMAAAVAAGKKAGGQADFRSAVRAMTGTFPRKFRPIPAHVKTYNELFKLYQTIHDGFGRSGARRDYSAIMKTLLTIRDRTGKPPA